MQILNRSNLAAGKLKVEASASAVPSRKPVGILQIGDGNFLRAFVDWMVDVTNGAGLFNGEVTLPDGRVVDNALRVAPNGDGTEVMFLLLRQPDMDDAAFESDAAHVARDLDALAGLMEERETRR